MTYFNTNEESGEILKESRRKTETQETKVLDYFERNRDSIFRETSAEIIHRDVFNYKVPLTSVRRALSVLKNRGEIEITKNMVTGIYGKKIHQYRYLTK